MSPRTTLERSLVGPAGEHYVLFRLHRLGMLSSLAPKNAPEVDVLVFADGETVAAGIQVKTRTRGSDGGWHMAKKHESLSRPHLLYALVDLEPPAPLTFIVPSAVVADVIRQSHSLWLATPGKKGQAHADNNMRRIRPEYQDVPGYAAGWMDAYKDRWDLITDLISTV